MADPYYEVIYLGSDVTGEARDKALQALKLLLNAKPEDAARILDSREPLLLRDHLTVEEARKLQSVLSPLGIRCNYKPCQQSQLTLEIVPIEPKEQDQPFNCPQCGYEIKPEPGQPRPELCPQCGLAFAKYEQKQQELQEKEAIRQRLRRTHQTRQQAQAEESQRDAEKRRREQYEAEIQKELGTPVMFRSRPRLIGSASLLFLTGLLGGIVGTRLLAPGHAPAIVAMSAPSAVTIPTPSSPPSPDQYRAVAQALANAKPNIQLLDMVEAVTSSPHSASFGGSGLPPARHILAPSSSGSGGPATPAVLPGTRTGPHAPSGLPVGAQLVGGIGAIETLRSMTLGRLANDRPQAAAALVKEMEQRLAGLESDPERIKALAWLGELQARTGHPEQGAQRIDHGIQLTARLGSGAERTRASAMLGAALIRMDQEDRGELLLKAANREFATITDPSAKLTTAADVAESYALAGQRGTALNLLDFVARSAASLDAKDERNAVYRSLALAHARLEDPSGTLAAVEQMSSPAAQDDALYEATRSLIQSGRLLWATDLADRLHAPLRTVSALALLAEAHTGSVESAAEAQHAYDRAESAAKLISDPSAKTQALAQLGRSYLAAGRADRAAGAFDAAQKAARSLQGRQKNAALAAVAAAQADALAIDQALATANEIADPAARTQLQTEIEAARNVAAALQAGPA